MFCRTHSSKAHIRPTRQLSACQGAGFTLQFKGRKAISTGMSLAVRHRRASCRGVHMLSSGLTGKHINYKHKNIIDVEIK